MNKKSAFTIVELMLIVAILGDLAVIAMPSFIRSREMAQNTAFINDLRIATNAFEVYSAENNGYPPNSPVGVVPPGMALYLQGMDFGGTNTLGGQWQWMVNQYSTTAQVATIFSGEYDDVRMDDIDARIDDGVLTTGAFRKQATGVYTYTIEW